MDATFGGMWVAITKHEWTPPLVDGGAITLPEMTPPSGVGGLFPFVGEGQSLTHNPDGRPLRGLCGSPLPFWGGWEGANRCL